MKRNLILAITLLGTSMAHAQVPNSSFEELNGFNNISQWGKTLLLSVIIDSSGGEQADSIVFDNQLYFATPDAHTGVQAMEMRNAYNFTSNQGIAGGAILTPDEGYSINFLSLVEVAPIQPAVLNFYYQYYPVGSDSAQAVLNVYDADGLQLGGSVVNIGGTHSAYELSSTPIDYTQPGTVHFIAMSFSTSIPGGDLHYGTRFIVDDVSLDGSLGLAEQALAANVGLYPNPATDQFSIQSDEPVEAIALLTTSGQQVPVQSSGNTFDCSQLMRGIYFVTIQTAHATVTRRLTLH